MKQIKILRNHKLEALELEVNTWLELNSRYDVLDVQVMKSYQHSPIAVIFYRIPRD